MEIAPGVYQVKVPIPNNPLGFLNSYLVAGKDGWFMVDTGWYTEDAFEALQAGLKELGLVLTDIDTMIITHVHPDHFGLAGRIKQVSPKTRLLAHRWEADLIESRYIKFSALRDKMGAMMDRHGVPRVDLSTLQSASMPALKFVTITMPDEALYGGETISTGVYDLEVIWTPGHSPGHICLYEPKNRLLFAGDHVLPDITPNISYHVQSGDNPLGDFINALRKLENLPVSRVLPAHQQIFEDLRGRIAAIVEHHEHRKREVLQAIRNGCRTAYDISARITWDIPGMTWEQFPPLEKRSAVTETVAHLECLRWEGKVTRRTGDGVIHYDLS